jgi:hypothetical protein
MTDFDPDVARSIDLVVLPSSIEGTNCGNCASFKHKRSLPPSVGYCDNSKVQMHVRAAMCCYYWNRPDAPVASRDDMESLNPKAVNAEIKGKMSYMRLSNEIDSLISRFRCVKQKIKKRKAKKLPGKNIEAVGNQGGEMYSIVKKG